MHKGKIRFTNPYLSHHRERGKGELKSTFWNKFLPLSAAITGCDSSSSNKVINKVKIKQVRGLGCASSCEPAAFLLCLCLWVKLRFCTMRKEVGETPLEKCHWGPRKRERASWCRQTLNIDKHKLAGQNATTHTQTHTFANCVFSMWIPLIHTLSLSLSPLPGASILTGSDS